MAKFRKGIVEYDDTGMMKLLEALGPESRETRLFIKDAMRNATGEVINIVKAASVAAGYPTTPGTRMTQGAGPSVPYKVFGRVPRAVRRGKFVVKRKDNGGTSQRVIVGSKKRGTAEGAPHSNIVRYSKNKNRITKSGQSRGRFAAKPFMATALLASQGAVFRGFEREYSKYIAKLRRIR